MEIIRGTENSGNYNTELYNILVSLPHGILFHSEHSLREPLGIYNVSLNRVLRAFENILIELKEQNNFEKIDLAHKELLESLMAYIDDGYQIMKCFYPKALVNGNIIFADQWLKKVDKQLIVEYKNNIEPFRNKIALIVNKTKHNHARYCHVEGSTLLGKVLGYYIEGIIGGGVICPDTEIHPMFNGEHTAISYNKDIRDNIANLYIISHLMANTIRKIVLKNHGVTLNETLITYEHDEKITTIFKDISLLRLLFFPDEYNGELTQIIIKDKEIRIKKPANNSYRNRLTRPKNWKMKTTMSGDGVTRSWALPYLKFE